MSLYTTEIITRKEAIELLVQHKMQEFIKSATNYYETFADRSLEIEIDAIWEERLTKCCIHGENQD